MPKIIPNSKEIEKAEQVGRQTRKGIRYYAKQFKKMIKRNKMDKINSINAKELIEKLDQVVKEVDYSLDSGANAWLKGIGAPRSSKVDNLQRGLANESAGILHDKIGDDIRMHIAISDNADIIRGYEAGNKNIVDSENPNDLDNLLNGWLAENDIISKDGSLYEKGEDGKIKTDDNGEPIRADADEVKDLINDSENGFDAYMERKGFHSSVQKHEFPKQVAAEPEAVEEVAEVASEKVASKETPATPAPSDQSTTPGGGSKGGGGM